mmetsp:Transcript_7680/g.31766  ORF Transcript_7680/g.31766 Transcript_7680/m.31766 type:complete len:471 (+) Transcript_7680:1521-2933(+)
MAAPFVAEAWSASKASCCSLVSSPPPPLDSRTPPSAVKSSESRVSYSSSPESPSDGVLSRVHRGPPFAEKHNKGPRPLERRPFFLAAAARDRRQPSIAPHRPDFFDDVDAEDDELPPLVCRRRRQTIEQTSDAARDFNSPAARKLPAASAACSGVLPSASSASSAQAPPASTSTDSACASRFRSAARCSAVLRPSRSANVGDAPNASTTRSASRWPAPEPDQYHSTQIMSGVRPRSSGTSTRGTPPPPRRGWRSPSTTTASPPEASSLTSSRASKYASTTCLPYLHARCAALAPSTPLCVAEQPASLKETTAATWPCRTAHWSAFSSRTPPLMFGSAPRSSSSMSTTAPRLLMAAHCSTVHPSSSRSFGPKSPASKSSSSSATRPYCAAVRARDAGAISSVLASCGGFLGGCDDAPPLGVPTTAPATVFDGNPERPPERLLVALAPDVVVPTTVPRIVAITSLSRGFLGG